MKNANDFWNEIPSAIQAKVDVNTVRIKDGVPGYKLFNDKTLTSTQQTTMNDLVANFDPNKLSAIEVELNKVDKPWSLLSELEKLNLLALKQGIDITK